MRGRETDIQTETVRDTETDGKRDRESFREKKCANDKCKAGVYGCADIGFSLSSGSLANGSSWDLNFAINRSETRTSTVTTPPLTTFPHSARYLGPTRLATPAELQLKNKWGLAAEAL